MTPEPHSPTGTDDPRSARPPAAPPTASGPGGLRRLYGPEAEDLGGLYEKLRAEHGTVAPVLLHGDVPAWLVLGPQREPAHGRAPRRSSPATPGAGAPCQDGSVGPDHPLMPHLRLAAHLRLRRRRRARAAARRGHRQPWRRIDHRGIRRHINRFSHQLVNEFCEEGSADLVSQFAEHLPMVVMCADPRHARRVRRPAGAGRPRHDSRAPRPPSPATPTSSDALTRLVARRRAEPGQRLRQPGSSTTPPGSPTTRSASTCASC